MNWFSILLAIYLSIGLKEAYSYIKHMNESISNRENGIQNDADTEEGLDNLEDANRYLGFQDQKKFIAFMFTFVVIAWLPLDIIGKALSKEE